MVADGIKYPMSPDRRQKLLDEQRQQDTTDDREREIVDHEEGLELQRLSISHELPSAKDDHVVCDYQRRRLPEGRHWRVAPDEPKV